MLNIGWCLNFGGLYSSPCFISLTCKQLNQTICSINVSTLVVTDIVVHATCHTAKANTNINFNRFHDTTDF